MMVSYKKKIEDCYTRCRECGRIFNNERYDMASYGYFDKEDGRKIYFCGYSCFMKHKRAKGKYAETETIKKDIGEVSVEGKHSAIRIYSPGGLQFI